VTRILIAEDEERIASFIDKGLKSSGYATQIVGDGHNALTLARSGRFDLLILDLGLPGRDGLEVLQSLRAQGADIPVVILTARDTATEVVAGLEGGADDYVTKPFRFEELLARVRVRLRGEPWSEPTVLRTADAELDLRARKATVNGRSVDLSARVRAGGDVLSPRRASPQPRAAPERRVGVRLRSWVERRRRVRWVSAQEDRARPNHGGPGHGVPTGTERRTASQAPARLILVLLSVLLFVVAGFLFVVAGTLDVLDAVVSAAILVRRLVDVAFVLVAAFAFPVLVLAFGGHVLGE
jgi:two-component system copper resistance phosphate regulon response regulator CusR